MPLLWPLWMVLPMAAAGSKFTQLRDSAEPVSALAAFLEKYVGNCPPAGRAQCEASARAFRSRANGRRYFMVASDEVSRMLSAGRFDPARGEYELWLTPFFAAGPYALTHGAPRQTDVAGNPVLPLVRMRGRAPDGWDASPLQRLISGQELRLEVVFTPQEVWTLRRKRGEAIRGVKSRVDALQVTHRRTGEIVASWP